jgi:hypothetical protein
MIIFKSIGDININFLQKVSTVPVPILAKKKIVAILMPTLFPILSCLTD